MISPGRSACRASRSKRRGRSLRGLWTGSIVGRVNDLYFVNIFSFGIFTTTSQRTPDERKHKIGKLAYIIEGVKEFRTMHAVPLEIEADGERFDLRSLMVLIFNGETAGGFHLARRSSIKDGLFDCILLEKKNFFRSTLAMCRYLAGGSPKIVRHLRVAADRHPFVGQRTHGRRRAEGRRIPAAHRVSGGRPARDVRQNRPPGNF